MNDINIVEKTRDLNNGYIQFYYELTIEKQGQETQVIELSPSFAEELKYQLNEIKEL